MITLRHNHVDLALHPLRESGHPLRESGHPLRESGHPLRDVGDAHPLLLLHGLGERSPSSVPLQARAWPGPVWALDFTGHGGSSIPRGGGYTAEVLMGDADAALEHLGPSTILGRGLGAYVALLIAGARYDAVRGAVLSDGPGLFGGPSGPTSPQVIAIPPGVTGPPDPFAMIELSRDVRPADYAATFARAAAEHSDLESPIAVAAIGRPPWLDAVVDTLALDSTTVEDALAAYAR